ncbi:SCO7613 C-terminal domain-containing membrane protein [Marmoricola endophyticus]|nr:hypothetical protein [Marmoricola endophyticus]
MSRLLDPRLCPDCRATVRPDGRCAACRLDLSGPLGVELWSVLTSADRIIEEIRAGQATAVRTAPAPPAAEPVLDPAPAPTASAPTPAPAPAPAQPVSATDGLASYPAGPRVPRSPSRLSGLTAPLILLGTGGLLVVVAAVLFLTVSWTSLPLGAKAAVAGVVTLGVLASGGVLARRGQRGGAETLTVLALALLALDVDAGRRSGLAGLDAMSTRTTLVVIGALLAVGGLLLGALAQRTTVRRLVLSELAAGVGLLVVSAVGLWTGSLPDGVGPVLAVVLAACAAVLGRRLGLAVASWAATGLVLASWLVLLAVGTRALAGATDRTTYWTGLVGWPLLAAALIAAAAAFLPRSPRTLRVLCAAVALSVAAGFAQGPLTDTTTSLVVLAATGVVLAAIAFLAPRTWALGSVLPGLVNVAALGLVVAVAPPVRVGATVLGSDTVWWARGLGGPLPAHGGVGLWLLVLVVGSGLAVAAGLLHVLGAPWRPMLPGLPAVACLTVLVRLGHSGEPLWLGVLLLVGAAVSTTVLALRSGPARRPWLLVLAAWLTLLALALAVPSAVLSAVLATALTVAAGVVVGHRDRTSSTAVGQSLAIPVGAVLATVLATYAGFGWTQVAGAGRLPVVVTLACVGALVLVCAAPSSRRTDTRLAYEGASALVLLVTASAASTGTERAWALGLLCTAGTVVAGRHVVDQDRRAWRPALALPAAVATTALASGAAHAWTYLAGASPLVASLTVALVGSAMLLGADLVCRHTATRLAAQVGATLSGATGYLLLTRASDLWLVLAVLGTSLTISSARHLVRWDRVTPHPVGAPVSAAVLVAATGAAAAGWAGTAGAGGTLTALLLAAVSAAYLLLSSRLARALTARVCLEATAVLVAVVTVSALPGSHDRWVVQAVVATALAAASVRHLVEQQRRPVEPTAAGPDPAVVAVVAAVLGTAYAVVAWTFVLDAAPLTRPVALCVVAVAALLGSYDVARRPAVRVAAEVTAVLVGAAGFASADGSAQSSLVLAALGTAATVLVLRHRDRHLVGMGAALLLALAESVRATGSLPGAPELVALPGAAVLVVAGYRRASAEDDSDTWTMLGAGLLLALVPSLLLTLGDPVQVRTMLVGAAALAALALGGVRRWQAPYLCGAAVLVVIALRFLGPVAASAFETAIGPWATFGVVGVALLVAGILWERALARVRAASGWVLALR